uniref:Uncharacterized protein n=1 Tax=viral metagenome TaxID=1070528 RepID=A0A6C0DP20_9ZZZZ
MNIINEKREEIIKENNNAQAKLMSMLETIPTYSQSISFSEPLHGDIDFSILEKLGFDSINHIRFEPGEITNIIGLPKQLFTLTCPENLLVNIENLPNNLKYIEIPHNYLTNIDISNLKNLETLNISDNKIQILENLPISLKNLIADHNELKYLDLKNMNNLYQLNISNNKITLIENLPEGRIDIISDNNPSIEYRTVLETIEKDVENQNDKFIQISYLESLNSYFKLKNNYESKIRSDKRKIMEKNENNKENKKKGKKQLLSYKPQCIKCKRPVGTIFSKSNNNYIVICGDTIQPCSLNIQIYPGDKNNIEHLINLFKEEVDSLRDIIIRQKLDTLFNYVTEDKSVELFKKELEAYNQDSVILKQYIDMNDELFHNNHKKKLIEQKNEKIFRVIENIRNLLNEYKNTKNRELLKTAVQLQVDELLPETRIIRMMKNEIMEIQYTTISNHNEYSVFKYPISLEKLDISIGEPSKVNKYNI